MMQYDEGADVIFAAAGGSGTGVLRASKDADRLSIGVDTNQNGLYPGHVLTSMVKRVDKAVFDTLRNAWQNNWQAGIKILGLKEGALDFAVDQNNRELVSQNIVDQVLIARERIVNGLIEVGQYSPK
jgi:basic membrane protein A